MNCSRIQLVQFFCTRSSPWELSDEKEGAPFPPLSVHAVAAAVRMDACEYIVSVAVATTDALFKMETVDWCSNQRGGR